MNYCPNCGSVTTLQPVDGIDRFVCKENDCNFIYWNNPVPVVAALVKLSGKYIIARNALWPNGIFSVITGYLEQKETPEEAVIREVSEELGLNSTVSRHIGNYSLFENNQVILCYEVEATGSINMNHELVEIKRLSPKELLLWDFSPLSITEKVIEDWKNNTKAHL